MIKFVACTSKDSEYCIMLKLLVYTLVLGHFDELLDIFGFYLVCLLFD